MHLDIDTRTIDPMALILSGNAYLIWVEKHHPHEPAFENLSDVLRALSDDEKRLARARARAMTAYGQAVEEALGTEVSMGAARLRTGSSPSGKTKPQAHS